MNSISELQKVITSSQSIDWSLYGDVRENRNGDLLILNYTQQAQFVRRWNWLERISRGLIINYKTGEIVARPFDKFFNWLEHGEKASGHIVNVTEKIDGSLGILYRDDSKYKIATRGSFDGEQALWASEFIKWYDLSDLDPSLTLLFEIVYPCNRIVVDYGDKEDLVLLAARNRLTGEYLPYFADGPSVYGLADKYGFSTPKMYQFNNISDIIELCGKIDANSEGFVVEFSDGSRWKFKGDRYKELHKLISSLSFKHTLEAHQNNEVEKLRQAIPDEFMTEANEWIAKIDETIAQIKVRVLAEFNDAPKSTRKEFALWTMQHHKEDAPYLFAMLDGKDIAPLIYKQAFQEIA
jgi:RNA ligase